MMETTLDTSPQKASIWSTGLAMFSMFFGAGNIVFPLALGQLTQSKSFFGISGLVITAVLVPLMGLLSMLLYNGDYMTFFRRIGKMPGTLVAMMILGLIGPLAGIPRCITISHSTFNAFGSTHLVLFSFVSCGLIFLFTIKPGRILTLLGYVLTPILLFSLAVIAVKGLVEMPHASASSMGALESFTTGLVEGYNTMDLLAAFFFSSVVLLCLRNGKSEGDGNKGMLSIALYGSLIAAGLLAAVYLVFSCLAAGFSAELASVPNHQMLGALAYRILGPYAGLVASVAVAFACLTTEIALTVVFAEFLHKSLFKERLSYPICLAGTLLVSFLVSTLHFEGISAFIVPILLTCYPALIVLCVLNILHKLFGFTPVKRIFYGTVVATLILNSA